MKKNIIIVIFLSSFLVGCSSSAYWVYPKFKNSNWILDKAECNRLANQTYGYNPPPTTNIYNSQGVLGMAESITDELNRENYNNSKSELFNECLYQKGYTREEAPDSPFVKDLKSLFY